MKTCSQCPVNVNHIKAQEMILRTKRLLIVYLCTELYFSNGTAFKLANPLFIYEHHGAR